MTEKDQRRVSEFTKLLINREPIQAQNGAFFRLPQLLNLDADNAEYLDILMPQRDKDDALVDSVPIAFGSYRGELEIVDEEPIMTHPAIDHRLNRSFALYPSLVLPEGLTEDLLLPYAIMKIGDARFYSPLEFEGKGEPEGYEVYTSNSWSNSSHLPEKPPIDQSTIFTLEMALFNSFHEDFLDELLVKI